MLLYIFQETSVLLKNIISVKSRQSIYLRDNQKVSKIDHLIVQQPQNLAGRFSPSIS